MKVVIVGSGPSLTNKKLGNLIDSYDIVVRVNWYPVGKREDDIGKKMDIFVRRIGTPGEFRYALKIDKMRCLSDDVPYPKPSEMWMVCQYRHTGSVDEKLRGIYGEQYVLKNATNRIETYMKENGIKTNALSGAHAIIAASLVYNTPVDVCGFTFDPKAKYRHYWESEETVHKGHEPVVESQAATLNLLKTSGLIGEILDA